MNSDVSLIIGLVMLAIMFVVQYLTRKVTNSFVTRTVSGVILILIALIVIIRGSWLLYAVCFVLSMIGLYEFYRALGVHQKGGVTGLEVAGTAGAVLYYLSVIPESAKSELMSIVAGLILVLSVYVFTFPKYEVGQVLAAFTGIVYVAVMLSFVYRTRMIDDGNYLVWLIFISSWGCDTCAYCFGRLFGKHHMTPVLSPHKTVEGAIGGVAGAAVLGLLYGLFLGEEAGAYTAISAAGALISMIGDLSASAIKRNAGIKDYGTLIPGHGGVLDRFDSVIFTAPVIYFMAQCLPL